MGYVEIVQRSYCDLSYMKVEHKLSNTTVISLLEEKLPKNIRREWSKGVTELESRMIEKQIIKHESAEIRMGMSGIFRQTPFTRETEIVAMKILQEQ